MATFRVPMLEQTVAATPERVSSPVLLDVADAGQGVRQLGGALETAAGIVQKVQAEADEVAIGQKLVDFERRANKRLMGEQLEKIDAAFEGTDRLPGFLETRGEAASKASGDVLKATQADVDELSGGLTPRQRTAFLEKVRALHMSVERKVDSHVLTELERAKGDTLKAFQSEVFRAIGADPMDPDLSFKSAMVEESLRKMATSPQAGEAAVADWKGQVALQQISGLLKGGNVPAAESLFGDTRKFLGTHADDVEAMIKQAKTAADIKETDVSALAEAQKWVTEAKPAGGYITRTLKEQLLTKLEATPVDQKREKLTEHLHKLLAIEQERFEADRDEHRNLVAGTGSPPPTSVAWLKKFDGLWWEARSEHLNEKWRRLQARKEGTGAEKRALEKKQDDNDKEFNNLWAALPYEEQAKRSPQEFAIELAGKRKGFTVSDLGISEALKHQRSTIEGLQKGDLTEERKFVSQANSRTIPLVTTRRQGKEVVDERVGGDPRAIVGENASKFYRSKRAALGRDPTPAEADEWLGELTAQEAVTWGKKDLPPAARKDFLPGGYGAPNPKQQVAPGKSVRMKFPNGKEYDVTPEQMEAARRKGAVPAVQEFPEVDLTR